MIEDDEGGAKELILGCAVKVDRRKLGLELIPLACDLLQLIVVALQALHVLIEAVLSLADGLLLIIYKFAPLGLKLHVGLPSLEELSLFDAFTFADSTLSELAESAQP